MTLEAYFWVFMALLVGFNLGAWVEGSDEPESVEIVEQVCVEDFPSDYGLKFKGLSSDARRDDI